MASPRRLGLLSLRASFGPISQTGFMTLAVLWLITTGLALTFAVQHRFADHRRWMLRSYALTAAAITLRIYLPLSGVLRLPFDDSYRAIAWLCWVLNLAAIELYLVLRPNLAASAKPRAPADLGSATTTRRLSSAADHTIDSV